MNTFLEFEQPIEELYLQQQELIRKQEENGTDFSSEIKSLESKINEQRKEIYKNLSAWQKVQVSRHPERPHALSYMEALSGGEFTELHGDRYFSDDKAIVGGFGIIDGQSVMMIGHQKGANTKMRQYRNFGMARPEGYRKAMRLMRLAEKFNKPIVTLIDTPGAYPGVGAEERGQSQAIAKNLMDMAMLKVPIICVVIGEGASGGALGIGLGDKTYMLEHAWYSVISPENCSAILWRTWDFKEQAAESLKLTAKDMLKNKLIDGIIKEPIGGAHAFPLKAFEKVKKAVIQDIESFKKVSSEKMIDARIKKYGAMGVYQTM